MSKKTTAKRATPAKPAATPRCDGAHPDRIAQRAYELYEQRGRQDGWAVEDWLQAERQLAGASRQSSCA